MCDGDERLKELVQGYGIYKYLIFCENYDKLALIRKRNAPPLKPKNKNSKKKPFSRQ